MTTKTKTLTPAQQKALDAIVARYLAEVAWEREHWGDASADRLAERGVFVSDLASIATLRALARKAAIEITDAVPTRSQELRRGAFGRWLGGTRDTFHSRLIARPIS